MTKTVTIWVVRDMYWDSNCPSKLADFAAWANDLLAKVPEEYRAQASVEVESDYESSSVAFSVWYRRDETDEEQAVRESREKAMADAARHRELAELQRLQAKYGKPPAP